MDASTWRTLQQVFQHYLFWAIGVVNFKMPDQDGDLPGFPEHDVLENMGFTCERDNWSTWPSFLHEFNILLNNSEFKLWVCQRLAWQQESIFVIFGFSAFWQQHPLARKQGSAGGQPWGTLPCNSPLMEEKCGVFSTSFSPWPFGVACSNRVADDQQWGGQHNDLGGMQH